MINGVQMKIENIKLKNFPFLSKYFERKLWLGENYKTCQLWILHQNITSASPFEFFPDPPAKSENRHQKTNNSHHHHLLPIHHCIILDFKTISSPGVHFPWLICRSGGQSEIGRSLGLEMLTESECDEASIKVMAVMMMMRRRGRMLMVMVVMMMVIMMVIMMTKNVHTKKFHTN